MRDYDEGIPVGRPIKEPYVHVPVAWVAASNRCPEHCASKVAILLWFLTSVTRQTTFKVGNSDAKKFALNRKQKAAGLLALERAGLISLTARSGKSPLVTINRTTVDGLPSVGKPVLHPFNSIAKAL